MAERDFSISANLFSNAQQGASRVVGECLGMSRGETLALFYDEYTEECAALIIDAALEQGINLVERKVSVARQSEISKQENLPIEDLDAISKSRAILVCLSSCLKAMPYRKRLVKRGVGDGPLGTMPGVTLEALAHAINVDYDQAWQRCSDLAVALLVGKKAVVTSYAFNQDGSISREHELVMRLGSFRRSPITSPGIIVNGTWGNLPGGETFIAPIEGSGNGTYVLNGAFTGHVLRPWLPIFLEFRNGLLVNVTGEAPEKQALIAMLKEGGHFRTKLGLAELGIGVNGGIHELKGNALFDEKKEGTVHIAVGDNEEYGGRLSAIIHEDFITSGPSLSVDGKSLLDHGKWVYRSGDWRESRSEAIALGTSLPRRFVVQRRNIRAYPDKFGRLVVRRDVGAKRVCIYSVGTEEISIDLANLYQVVPDSLVEIHVDLLITEYRERFASLEVAYLRGLLAVLAKHQLIAISRGASGRVHHAGAA